jgi:hypothetical protein
MANLGESAASAPAANPSGAVGIVRDLLTAVDVADFATIDALLLAQCPPDQPIMDAVRTVVVEFNRFDSAQVHWHRKHMELRHIQLSDIGSGVTLSLISSASVRGLARVTGSRGLLRTALAGRRLLGMSIGSLIRIPS